MSLKQFGSGNNRLPVPSTDSEEDDREIEIPSTAISASDDADADLDIAVDAQNGQAYIDVNVEDDDDEEEGDANALCTSPSSEQLLIQMLDKFARMLILPYYVLTAVASIAVLVLSFVPGIQQLISLLGICVLAVLNVLGSVTGAVGTYKYGTVSTAIDDMKDQNQLYATEIENLKSSVGNLKTVVAKVHTSVDHLQKSSKELDANLDQFEELRNSLQEIVGENVEILSMLEEINQQCVDMKVMVAENQRAHILSIYYDCEFGDTDSGLSAYEYQMFEARLNRSTRDVFQNLGGFKEMDVDGNGNISLEEFQHFLHRVLVIVQETVLRETMKNAEM